MAQLTVDMRNLATVVFLIIVYFHGNACISISFVFFSLLLNLYQLFFNLIS
jgi:hypothetical protein